MPDAHMLALEQGGLAVSEAAMELLACHRCTAAGGLEGCADRITGLSATAAACSVVAEATSRSMEDKSAWQPCHSCASLLTYLPAGRVAGHTLCLMILPHLAEVEARLAGQSDIRDVTDALPLDPDCQTLYCSWVEGDTAAQVSSQRILLCPLARASADNPFRGAWQPKQLFC